MQRSFVRVAHSFSIAAVFALRASRAAASDISAATAACTFPVTSSMDTRTLTS